MSASSEDSQKAKKQCVVFEPQAWRKTLCRNCFKTRNDHAAAAAAADSDTEHHKKATSPVVTDDDVVIIRREGTPMKDGSRGATPTAGSRPSSPAVTPAGDKNVILPEQSASALVGNETDGQAVNDGSSDKKRDKTSSKSSSEVDKNSNSGKKSAATTSTKVQAKDEAADLTAGLKRTEKRSSDQVTHENRDGGETSKADAEQSAESQPAAAARHTTAAGLSQCAEHEVGGAFDTHGHVVAPTSAREPVAVGEAVNSSAVIKSPADDDAGISVHSQAASPAESGHHDNAASSAEVMAGQDTCVAASHEQDGSSWSSNIIARCTDDDDASAAVAAAAATAGSRSSDASDEMVGDAASCAAGPRSLQK